MNYDPQYLAEKRRIYTTYQKYRRLRDILAYVEQHQYPEQEPFMDMFIELTRYLREENILEAKQTARDINSEWLKWRYEL